MALYMSKFEVMVVARAAGFSEPWKAAAIAMAESSGRPWVVNSIGCVGLWQINQPVHVKAHPRWTRKWLQDPANNAKAAYVISKGGTDWSPWEAYTGRDGKGSDGPWRDHMEGVDVTDRIGNAIEDPVGDVGGAIGDAIDGAVQTAEELSRIAQAIAKAGNWLSNPQNWVRIGFVAGGGVLLFVGLGMVAKGTPVGQAAQKVAGMAVTKGRSAAAGAASSRKAARAGRAKDAADAAKRAARVQEAYDKTRARAEARADAKKAKGK